VYTQMMMRAKKKKKRIFLDAGASMVFNSFDSPKSKDLEIIS